MQREREDADERRQRKSSFLSPSSKERDHRRKGKKEKTQREEGRNLGIGSEQRRAMKKKPTQRKSKRKKNADEYDGRHKRGKRGEGERQKQKKETKKKKKKEKMYQRRHEEKIVKGRSRGTRKERRGVEGDVFDWLRGIERNCSFKTREKQIKKERRRRKVVRVPRVTSQSPSLPASVSPPYLTDFSRPFKRQTNISLSLSFCLPVSSSTDVSVNIQSTARSIERRLLSPSLKKTNSLFLSRLCPL